jgi:hypothetical protein
MSINLQSYVQTLLNFKSFNSFMLKVTIIVDLVTLKLNNFKNFLS